jgi:hypothetical protein
MIIHCTQKLAKNLKEVSPTPLAEKSSMGSWHANLYTIDSRKCVIFCHDATRYCLFMAGLRKPDFMELGGLHRKLYLAALEAQGVPSVQLAKVALGLGPSEFDCATDRSTLSSLNQAISDLDGLLYRVANVMELKSSDIAAYFNERPVTVRKNWLHPNKEMLKMIDALFG